MEIDQKISKQRLTQTQVSQQRNPTTACPCSYQIKVLSGQRDQRKLHLFIQLKTKLE